MSYYHADTGTNLNRALDATGSDDVVVSPLEEEHVVQYPPGAGAELASLDLVPPGAEPAALEATGSEEISVKVVPAVDVPAVDGQSVEGGGGETIETSSLTSTVAQTECDGDCFMLPNLTDEFTNILQFSGGYLDTNALCVLMGMPLSNSGHY